MTFAWIPVPGSPPLGLVAHLPTPTSRRRAVVVAVKPGFALFRFATDRAA